MRLRDIVDPISSFLAPRRRRLPSTEPGRERGEQGRQPESEDPPRSPTEGSADGDEPSGDGRSRVDRYA